jgi:hypothetical protein
MKSSQIIFQTFQYYIRLNKTNFFSFEIIESVNIFINIFKNNIPNFKVVSINELFENFLNYSKNFENPEISTEQIDNFINQNYINTVLLINFEEFVSNIEQFSFFLKKLFDCFEYFNKDNLFLIIDDRILNLVKIESKIINLDNLDFNLFLNLIDNILLLVYNLRENFSNNFLIKLIKYCNNSILDLFIVYEVVAKVVEENLNNKVSFNRTFIKEILYYLEENFNFNKGYIGLINKQNFIKLFSLFLNSYANINDEETKDFVFLYDLNIKDKIFYKYYILNNYYNYLEDVFVKDFVNDDKNNDKNNIDNILVLTDLIINSIKSLKRNTVIYPFLYLSKVNLVTYNWQDILQIMLSISKSSSKELSNILIYLRENLSKQFNKNLFLLFRLLSVFLGNKFLLVKIKEIEDISFLLLNLKDINLNVINLKETILIKVKNLKNLYANKSINIEEIDIIELKNIEKLKDIFIDFIISTINTAVNTLNIEKIKIIELILDSNLLANNINFLNNKAFYYILINDINKAYEYLMEFYRNSYEKNIDSIVVYNIAYISYVNGDYKHALKLLEENLEDIKNESYFSVIKTILPIPFNDIVKKIKDSNLNPNLEFFFNIEFNIPVYLLFLLSIANIYYILDQREKALKIIKEIENIDYQFNIIKKDDIKFYKKSISIIYKDKSQLPKDNTFELFLKLIS